MDAKELLDLPRLERTPSTHRIDPSPQPDSDDGDDDTEAKQEEHPSHSHDARQTLVEILVDGAPLDVDDGATPPQSRSGSRSAASIGALFTSRSRARRQHRADVAATTFFVRAHTTVNKFEAMGTVLLALSEVPLARLGKSLGAAFNAALFGLDLLYTTMAVMAALLLVPATLLMSSHVLPWLADLSFGGRTLASIAGAQWVLVASAATVLWSAALFVDVGLFDLRRRPSLKHRGGWQVYFATYARGRYSKSGVRGRLHPRTSLLLFLFRWGLYAAAATIEVLDLEDASNVEIGSLSEAVAGILILVEAAVAGVVAAESPLVNYLSNSSRALTPHLFDSLLPYGAEPHESFGKWLLAQFFVAPASIPLAVMVALPVQLLLYGIDLVHVLSSRVYLWLWSVLPDWCRWCCCCCGRQCSELGTPAEGQPLMNTAVSRRYADMDPMGFFAGCLLLPVVLLVWSLRAMHLAMAFLATLFVMPLGFIVVAPLMLSAGDFALSIPASALASTIIATHFTDRGLATLVIGFDSTKSQELWLLYVLLLSWCLLLYAWDSGMRVLPSLARFQLQVRRHALMSSWLLTVMQVVQGVLLLIGWPVTLAAWVHWIPMSGGVVKRFSELMSARSVESRPDLEDADYMTKPREQWNDEDVLLIVQHAGITNPAKSGMKNKASFHLFVSLVEEGRCPNPLLLQLLRRVWGLRKEIFTVQVLDHVKAMVHVLQRRPQLSDEDRTRISGALVRMKLSQALVQDKRQRERMQIELRRALHRHSEVVEPGLRQLCDSDVDLNLPQLWALSLQTGDSTEVVKLPRAQFQIGLPALLAQAIRANSSLRKLILPPRMDKLVYLHADDVSSAEKLELKLADVSELDFSDWGRLDEDVLASIAEGVQNSNVSLHSLVLSSLQLDDDAVEVLAGALGVNTTLTALELRGNRITDTGVECLFDALARNTRSVLTKLDLGFNSFGPVAVKAMASAPGPLSSLTDLVLDSNDIGDKGVRYLREAVENTVGCLLRRLVLRANGISADGAKDLAEILLNTSVDVLDVGRNQLGDKGARALLEFCNNSVRSLRELDLSFNELGEDSCVAVAAFKAEAGKQLLSLDLSGNPIGGAGVQALCGAAFARLSLRKCGFKASDGAALVQLLEHGGKEEEHGGEERGEEEEEEEEEEELSLEFLDLSGNGDGVCAEIEAIGSALGRHSSLVEVVLEKCRLENDAVNVLGAALEQNPLLASVRLAGNRLSAEAMQELLVRSGGRVVAGVQSLETGVSLSSDLSANDEGEGVGAGLCADLGWHCPHCECPSWSGDAARSLVAVTCCLPCTLASCTRDCWDSSVASALDTAETRVDVQIEEEQSRAERVDKSKAHLVFFGDRVLVASAVRNVTERNVHEPPAMTAETRAMYTNTARRHVVLVARTLCEAVQALNVDLQPETQDAVDAMLQHDEPMDLDDVAGHIRRLWRDQELKARFSEIAEAFPAPLTAADYFLDRLAAILAPEYTPTEDDIEQLRWATTRLGKRALDTEVVVPVGPRSPARLRLTVAPAECKQQKWVKMFEHATVVVFCIDISRYDCAPVEDPDKNELQESMGALATLCRSLGSSGDQAYFVLLGGKSKFEEKLRTTPLRVCPLFAEQNEPVAFEDALQLLSDKVTLQVNNALQEGRDALPANQSAAQGPVGAQCLVHCADLDNLDDQVLSYVDKIADAAVSLIERELRDD